MTFTLDTFVEIYNYAFSIIPIIHIATIANALSLGKSCRTSLATNCGPSMRECSGLAMNE